MKAKQILFALGCLAMVACAREELETEVSVAPGFKLVTVNATVSQTRSAVADDGTFSWSDGDVISVLATDGNFYDFKLSGETSFSGAIPEEAKVTTVAAYPAVAANGTNEGVYAGGVLNFTLAPEFEALEGCSNIPMVASFEEGAEAFDFKQVGAAFKFHVDGAPADFFAEVTFTGTNPTGTFAIDPSKAGTAALEGVASETPVAVTAHYVSESAPVDGATFYVPVPVGPYTALHVKLYEKNGEEVPFYDADRVRESGDYTVARGDIFIMKPISVEVTMRIERVHPFFTDAKVVFVPNGAATAGYAFYVDDATEPVIVSDPDIDHYNVGATYTAEGKIDLAVAGAFELGSTHTVAVAPVGADGVIEKLKSDPVSFTTGHIEQYTGEGTNQGPHQLTMWLYPDDYVARTDYTKSEDVFYPTVAYSDTEDVPSAKERVFHLQLFASNDPNSTPVYDLLGVDRQTVATGAFASSSWIGKVDGENAHSPDRASFGYLDPETTYYFRARTIDPVDDLSCYGGGVTISVSSRDGGSAWSPLVPATTQPMHVAGANEVLYQGFDDLMLSGDFVNSASGLVPYLNINGPDKKNFQSKAKNVLVLPWTGEFTFNNFNTSNNSDQWGLVGSDKVYTSKAGSLAGWKGINSNRNYPGYGNIRIGNNTSIVEDGIESPALYTNLTDEPQTCTVTLKGCPINTDPTRVALSIRVDYLVPDANVTSGYHTVYGKTLSFDLNRYPILADPKDWDENNYFYEYGYQELRTMVKLAKGYKIRIVAAPTIAHKRIILDDILVELTPDVPYEGSNDVADNNVLISEPDDTDYDAFKTGGDLPISYWFHIPTENESMEQYQRLKEAGFNVILSNNYNSYSVADNLRILDTYCKELGFQYIGKVNIEGWGWAPETQAARFADIDQYVTHPNYIGQYCGDEPHTSTFEGYDVWFREYYNRYHSDPSAAYYNPNAHIYVNLFPCYAGEAQLGTNYEDYVNQWIDGKIGLKSVSFDHYPLGKTKGEITLTYYYNLDLIRAKTLEKRIHFWMIGNGGYTGSTAFEVTEKEMRWNAWSALAMGSKGYQYFCYWTPPANDFDKDQYMINSETGEPTDRYYYAKELNKDMQYFKSLLQCHADGGIMVPLGAYNMVVPKSAYGALTGVSGHDSITGCFRGQDGSYKVLVTHLKPSTTGTDTCEVTLHFDNTVTSVTTTYSEDGSTATVPVSNGIVTLTFPEGEAYLVEWN